ncbi:MAG: alpha/beta hydrolase, partial [Hyphomicrobium sp.]
MRTADVDILMVPGWLGCEPDHWQSRWVRNLKTAKLIGEEDWATPDKDKWVDTIVNEVAATSRPTVIVAHSVGVIAVVHAALKLPKGAVAGAFLVSAADIDNAQRWPVTQGDM